MTLPERDQPLILIVDDEQNILDEVGSVLTGNGFACRSCTTAAAAIALAPAILPDLILSDSSLQETSGLEMCDQIKRHRPLAEVPVMFLVPGQVPDIIRRNDGNGGAYHLRKPCDPGVLVELIDRALGTARPVAVEG